MKWRRAVGSEERARPEGVWEAGEEWFSFRPGGPPCFAVALHTPPSFDLWEPNTHPFVIFSESYLSPIDYQHLRDKQGFQLSAEKEERVGVSQPTAAHTPSS